MRENRGLMLRGAPENPLVPELSSAVLGAVDVDAIAPPEPKANMKLAPEALDDVLLAAEEVDADAVTPPELPG
jgi:hypothetical protein